MSLFKSASLFAALCLSLAVPSHAAPAQTDGGKAPTESRQPKKPASTQQARPEPRKRPCPKPRAAKPAKPTASDNVAATSGGQGYNESYYAAQDLRDEVARSTDQLRCDEIADDAY
ncbi:MAG: hypothetical protein EON58_15405, partial [Alphaproteobacteria bacterium]